jgi:hypothetical protein
MLEPNVCIMQENSDKTRRFLDSVVAWFCKVVIPSLPALDLWHDVLLFYNKILNFLSALFPHLISKPKINITCRLGFRRPPSEAGAFGNPGGTFVLLIISVKGRRES